MTETVWSTMPVFIYLVLYKKKKKVCWTLLYSTIIRYCINWFSDVKPHLYFWDQSHLIMIQNPFMFLDSVCYNFVRYFCISVPEGYWSDFLLLWCRCLLALVSEILVWQNELWSSSSFILWMSLKIGVISSLNIWWNSPVKSSGPVLFFVG